MDDQRARPVWDTDPHGFPGDAAQELALSCREEPQHECAMH